MGDPQLAPEQVGLVSQLVAEYITDQQQQYRNRATPLTQEQMKVVSNFFREDVLSARVLVLQNERVRNPEFYPMLRHLGFSNLPDQTRMTAITFSDVIVSHESFTKSLLFHELVHVEQYRQLGIPRFAELYVRGFLDGGGYDGIPLEVNAYSLGARFEANPQQGFSVTDEVSAWIRDGRL